MSRTWPFHIRHCPPHEGCVPLPMPERPGDAPEGVHSGGLWLDPETQRVWKPALGLWPDPHTPSYVETCEVELLMFAAANNVPCFPKNWDYVWTADRPWIVRSLATPLMTDDPQRLEADARTVEQGVRRLNQLGWEVGDTSLQVMRDPTSDEPFVVDCSCGCYRGINKRPPWAADDSQPWLRWIKSLGLTSLARLREAGRHVVTTMNPAIIRYHRTPLTHVYLSRNRPFSFVWARRDEAGSPIVGECIDRPDIHEGGIFGHTWVATARPLSAAYQATYELTYAWSPIPRIDEDDPA